MKDGFLCRSLIDVQRNPDLQWNSDPITKLPESGDLSGNITEYGVVGM